MFFGPLSERIKDVAAPEEDLSSYIVLTSIVGDNDGIYVAVFRDSSTDN